MEIYLKMYDVQNVRCTKCTGKIIYHPIKVYCYQSIISSLRNLVQQPRILQLLDHWKTRNIPHGVMCDVYDGAVWRLFIDDHNALTLAFLLNVDWFQPYKHVAYSVGAIYITILNLPRQLRNRRKIQKKQLLKGIFGSAYQRTMLLYTYSSAACISGELYGSLNSIQSNSAMIYTKSSENGSYCPGVSCRYMKVNIILKLPNQDIETVSVYLSGLNKLQEHPENNWFHSPVEVWRKIDLLNLQPNTFIPVSSIVCRCAYIFELIRFNRILEDTVTVVVPLSNFWGL